MPTLTSTDILHGLNAARYYGHVPSVIRVPRSWDHPARVDGVTVEPGDVDEPTIVTAEGAQLDMRGHTIGE
jgi:hypothetical protein